MNLRAIAAGGALGLALLAPATANAAKTVKTVEVAKTTQSNGGAPGVWVCNEAGAAFLGGNLNVTDAKADPDPPARFKFRLKPLPGGGVGLVRASEQSPALALCGPAAPTGNPTDPIDPVDPFPTDPVDPTDPPIEVVDPNTGGGTGGGPSGDNG